MRGISLVVEQVVAKFVLKFCKNDQIRVRFPDTACLSKICNFPKISEILINDSDNELKNQK